jgi:hypothetical protein
MECDYAEVEFRTKTEAPLITDESTTIYPKLSGKDHSSSGSRKTSESYFWIQDVKYAEKFAKAFGK